MPINRYGKDAIKTEWEWVCPGYSVDFNVNAYIISQSEVGAIKCERWNYATALKLALSEREFLIVYNGVPRNITDHFRHWKKNVQFNMLKGLTPNYAGHFYEYSGKIYRLGLPPDKCGLRNYGVPDGIFALYSDEAQDIIVNDVQIEMIPRKPCQ